MVKTIITVASFRPVYPAFYLSLRTFPLCTNLTLYTSSSKIDAISYLYDSIVFSYINYNSRISWEVFVDLNFITGLDVLSVIDFMSLISELMCSV